MRLLVAAVPSRSRDQRLREVGDRFGRELARLGRLRPENDPAHALARLCEAVRALGFHATLESVAADRAVVVTPMCPLRAFAGVHELGAVDAGMWNGLISAALGRTNGEGRCTIDGCGSPGGACRISVQLPPARAAARRATDPG
ncbi:MAG: hypothetical protein ICV64_12140 [Thermoleophilia bacterium]|nr:hypothetical protein [Thermoleophilia bacterium]